MTTIIVYAKDCRGLIEAKDKAIANSGMLPYFVCSSPVIQGNGYLKSVLYFHSYYKHALRDAEPILRSDYLPEETAQHQRQALRRAKECYKKRKELQ